MRLRVLSGERGREEESASSQCQRARARRCRDPEGKILQKVKPHLSVTKADGTGFVRATACASMMSRSSSRSLKVRRVTVMEYKIK